MNVTLTKCLAIGLLAGSLSGLGGCGTTAGTSNSAPVVIGELVSQVQIPTYNSSWLETKTVNGTTTDQMMLYLNGTNIVALKTNATIGATSQVDNMTDTVISNVIVAGQQVTVSQTTGTLATGVDITTYVNGWIESGAVTINGDNVTAAYTIVYVSGESVYRIARTLTGTVSADGKTYNFTHVNIASTPAQSTDGGKDVIVTWTQQP